MIAAYGTSRMTAIELPRHNAVMPAVRTISAAVRMPDEIVKGRDVLTWYMIFTRSIGAVSSFETPPAAAPDIKSAVALSFGGIGWPETVCRRLRLRGGVRCGPLSGGGGGGSDELEALLLDCDDAMRRARGSSHVRSQLAMFRQVLKQLQSIGRQLVAARIRQTGGAHRGTRRAVRCRRLAAPVLSF